MARSGSEALNSKCVGALASSRSHLANKQLTVASSSQKSKCTISARCPRSPVWLGLRMPLVRWRAAHRWLFSDEIKYFKTNTSTWRSGKLSE
jgi:hypothetical protein